MISTWSASFKIQQRHITYPDEHGDGDNAAKVETLKYIVSRRLSNKERDVEYRTEPCQRSHVSGLTLRNQSQRELT